MPTYPKIQLTKQEIRILTFVAEGLTTPLIAARMCLSAETIKWYRRRIMQKFSASTSAEVVRKAIEENII
jgi:DNA-binding NarL/FixJ family response regulator